MKVTIVDYGMGNLFSVGRAFAHSGADVEMAETPDQILAAERLVLPGVGAFADGMAELRSRNLVEPLRAFAAGGRPFLGICLGMQMLFDESEEFGTNLGLGIIPGKVVAIEPTATSGEPHKIPHIGWNKLERPSTRAHWDGSLLKGIDPGTSMYFVHSFTASPAHASDRLADAFYNGRLISAAVARANVTGCQFHPERSSQRGLSIVANFLDQQ